MIGVYGLELVHEPLNVATLLLHGSELSTSVLVVPAGFLFVTALSDSADSQSAPAFLFSTEHQHQFVEWPVLFVRGKKR